MSLRLCTPSIYSRFLGDQKTAPNGNWSTVSQAVDNGYSQWVVCVGANKHRLRINK